MGWIFNCRRPAGVVACLAALALTLATAGAAQAAIGTSTPFVPQNRPGLVSVTDQGGTGLVLFCFQASGGQAIAPPPPVEGPAAYDPGDFILGGYDESFRQQAATVEQFNNNCVQATFATGEIPKYTIGTVNENAVVAIIAGNPVGNLADSAPLIGSNTNNGTRNFTSGLDLVNVTSPGSNRLAFIFDQNVRTDSLPEGCPPACFTEDFLFYDGAGELHGVFGAGVVSITDNIVVIEYQNPPDAVADARIALVRHRACVSGLNGEGGGEVFIEQFGFCGSPLRADTPFGGSNRTSLGSAAVAGVPGTGNTAKIELTGAALVNGGNSNQIDFTFETNVALGDSAPGCFTATTSNNRRLFGDSASVNGNVVTVTFQGMQDFSEMIVRAGIQDPDFGGEIIIPLQNGEFLTPDCVHSPTGEIGNTMGSRAVGGNVGAVGTGYTTAPDALGLTVSGGNVTVPVDQRVDPATIDPADVILLDNQGNPIVAVPSSAAVFGNGSPNDPHSVVFTFDPVAAQAAAAMQLLPGALSSFGTPGVDEFDSEPNVVQVFAR